MLTATTWGNFRGKLGYNNSSIATEDWPTSSFTFLMGDYVAKKSLDQGYTFDV